MKNNYTRGSLKKKGSVKMTTDKQKNKKPSKPKERFDVELELAKKLIEEIKESGKLPWQAPFNPPKMNWFTNKEYLGINKLILKDSEYITMKQLQEYNKANDTKFHVKKGTKAEWVIYYNRRLIRQSQEQIAKIKSSYPSQWQNLLIPDEEGYLCRPVAYARYYNVFSIVNIEDDEGNKLQPKIGVSVFEEHTDSTEIVDNYTQRSGVKIVHGKSNAYYTRQFDHVGIPYPEAFKDTEYYYRVLFHELIHSTGVEKRLNRPEYVEYHDRLEHRSKEELVAEYGSLLLASEAGFKNENNEYLQNAQSYLASWLRFLQNDPKILLYAMKNAEKAKNYILTGSTNTSDSERSVKKD